MLDGCLLDVSFDGIILKINNWIMIVSFLIPTRCVSFWNTFGCFFFETDYKRKLTSHYKVGW